MTCTNNLFRLFVFFVMMNMEVFMRIGEFSKNTQTSIDTIRHYIALGLLVPTKEGKYFKFDEKCFEDLKKIIEMKNMDFSLQEIKNILLVSRFSKLTLGQERQHYRSFFRNKMKVLIEEKDKLEGKIDNLEETIEALDIEFKQEPTQLGVDLSFLQNLYCPDCQKPLKLDQADIQENMIVQGQMSCTCDYGFDVKNGIIIDHQSAKHSEETDETYFIKYVDETNKHFLDNLYAAMEWSNRVIKFPVDNNQTVLELGVGHGIFLSHIYNDLPDNVTYVAVDYDYNKLRYIKKVFERSGIKKNIIFICSDFNRIPIKHYTADYVIDFFGMSNYSFRNDEFLHQTVERYYKEHCKMLGVFMLFDKFKVNEELSPDQYRLFKKKNILDYLSHLGFKGKDEYLVGYSEEGEKDDVYFEVTNRIYVYGYLGQR